MYSQSKKCTREVETITRKWCKLEYEKTCTTETKAFTKITGYERGDCKEVEFCMPDYGKYGNVVAKKKLMFISGYPSHHGYRGKRSPGYNASAGCEKVSKEVCKRVPVKEEANREVEKCTRSPKEVSRRNPF